MAGSIAVAFFGSPLAEAGHDDEEPTNLVPADRIKRLLDIGENVVFVDLRSTGEFEKARLPAARSIPVAELTHRWTEIPKIGQVVLYCPCPMGARDETFAFLLLRTEHYRNVSVLEGGFTEWTKRAYPVESASR
jgi:rhodanese-related sulfurtransferase